MSQIQCGQVSDSLRILAKDSNFDAVGKSWKFTSVQVLILVIKKQTVQGKDFSFDLENS